VLTKNNQKITHKSFVISSSQENERKPYFRKVSFLTLTFDLKNTKYRNVKPSARSMYVKYETYVVYSSKDNEGQPLFYK